MAYKFCQFLEICPLFGFNSSGYDIPLTKDHLIERIIVIDKIDNESIDVTKKNNKYIKLCIKNFSDFGGLMFLDICQFLAAGFNLDNFLKAFGMAYKGFFPYEYIDSYE